MKYKLSDFIEINPKEIIPKGKLSKKISMDVLQPFCRDISSFSYEEYSGGSKFRNGDTIMARITPCLENGKTSYVNILDNNEVGFGSTEYIVFRAKAGICEPAYVYYLVSSPVIRDIAIRSMVGSSGRQRVQTDVVANIEVDLPSIHVQKKIAGILALLDDKIYTNNKINKNLAEQAKSFFRKMVLDDTDIEHGVLSDIANIVMGQSPNGDTYNESGEGTVFFQGRAEFGERFPTRRLFTTKPKRMAEENDVLMSVRAPVGDINVAIESCCIGRGLSAIHSKDNHQSFVLYTMYSLEKDLHVFNGEGTVFGSINKGSLQSVEISKPSKQVMDAFEQIVSPIDALIKTNYLENCRLIAIRDSLLPKLMSGELDISDIYLDS